MAHLRLTLLKPHPGRELELRSLLEDLDATLARQPGLLLSFVIGEKSGRIGRVALWQSKHEADQHAVDAHVLSLRSRLHYCSADAEEALMEVKTGHLPEGISSILHAPKRPLIFEEPVYQERLLEAV